MGPMREVEEKEHVPIRSRILKFQKKYVSVFLAYFVVVKINKGAGLCDEDD